MKSFGSSLLIAALASLVLAGAKPASALDAITIDAGVIVNDTARHQIGINTNYLMDAERRRTVVPPRTTKAALQEMGVKYLRYPGGEKADTYLWSVPPWTGPQPTLARTGPLEWPSNSRQFTLDDNATWVPGKAPFDFDEFMTMAQELGAEPVIVLAYDSMYKELTASGTRPTRDQLLANAVEWVRYANVTKGYNVKYWSLGNETDYFVDGNPGALQYALDLQEFSRQMKAVDPTIKIGAQAGSSLAWFQTVLETSAADIDFLDVHDYPNYGWTGGYETFRSGTPVFTTFAELAAAAIQVYAPEPDRGRIKVAVTETGAFDYSGVWEDRNDAGHALILFDILGQHLRMPAVDFVQYWNTRWVNNDGVGLPLGTTNLLATNPGFEAGFDGWTVNVDATAGNSAIVTAPADVHGGSQALRVAGDTAGGRGQVVTDLLTTGEVYTLSLWAKVTSTTALSVCGVTLYQGTAILSSAAVPVTAPDYTLYSVSFMAPSGFDYADVWCHKAGSVDVLYADDFRLASGGVPSALTALGPKNELFASGRVLAIWNDYLHDTMVEATGTPMVPAHASRATDTSALSVFLVNKDLVARDATVALNGYASSGIAQRRVFKGSGPGDLTPTWSAAPDLAVDADQVALTLDPVSITVLTFSTRAAVDVALASATPDPSVFGQTVTLVASVAGNLPTGTVSFLDGAATLCADVPLAGGQAQCATSALAVASHDLVAAYAGDANNEAGVSPALVRSVVKADTSTTVDALTSDPSAYGAPIAVGAAVAATAPGSGIPSGTITVSDGSAQCQILLPATGCSLTPTSAGPRTLTATYGGDGNFNGSVSSGLGHTVEPPPPPPALLAAFSRKQHGAAGVFDLPLSAAPSSLTVEPRTGGAAGAHTVVFVFDKEVTSGSVAITSGTATPDAPTFDGNQMSVALSGVTNAQYVTVSVSDVTSADGGAGGAASVRIGFLLGDSNQSRAVSLADLLAVNALLAQTVTAASFRNDVNASGTFTLADKLIVNANLTKALPPP